MDREIVGLALPALGALVAEPLFVLVDSAVVGRLGTEPLAGLALASTVLVTIVGLCVFLAYATTATVARRLGAGDRETAARAGLDGLGLALVLGVLLAGLVFTAAPRLVVALGAHDEVAHQAVTYLRWSAPGLPGMLVVLAATGALRGRRDTRTPLAVATAGAAVNAGLNGLLVLGLGLGIAGSGAGTAVVQLAMGAVLAATVLHDARTLGLPLRLRPAGLMAAAAAGAPLLVRTLSLRAAILVTVAVATSLGEAPLAAHQVVSSVWGLAAFALDALAIAAQALVGHGLGAHDEAAVRLVVRRTLTWGVAAGAVLGLVLAAAAPVLVRLFSSDDDVRSLAARTLLVVAATLPMAGWVFVLDGVLIGAGEGRYLAWAGAGTLVVYLPAAAAAGSLPGLWASFAGLFMLARAATTGWRAREWLFRGFTRDERTR